jgi:hypothetical protein
MLSLLPVLLAVSAQVQDVEIVPRWKTGDRIKLEYLRTRHDSRRPQNDGTSKTPVDIEILKVDGKGSVIRWKNGPTQMPAGMTVPAELQPLLAKAAELELEIQLDPTGEFRSIINTKQVTDLMSQMLAQLLKEMDSDPNKIAAIRQILNPEVLLASASNDAKTYFGIYGAALKPKEKVKVRIDQPFPINPATVLPSDFELELVAVEGDLAKFKSSTRFEPKGLESAMAELFTKAGVKVEDLPKMPALTLNDEGEYQYDIKTGVMTSVVADRRTELPGSLSRRDRKEFRLR